MILLMTLVLGVASGSSPDLVAAIEALRADNPTEWAALPTLSPVPDPHVTSPFRANRNHPVTGERRPHFGMDLRAPTGTRIRAAGDGRILSATRTPSYGLVVDIDHGNGYVTRYAHLSEIGVQAGQRVRRGQTIGRSGTSGSTTGPNLHYEIYRNQWQVDPCPFVIYRAQNAAPEPLACPTPG